GGMFRYLVSMGSGHLLPTRPRGFVPEKSVELEVGGGLAARIFVQGGGRVGGVFFRGIAGEGPIFVGESLTPDDEHFPERLAAYDGGRLVPLLQSVDGFYGGVVVGDGLTCLTDHMGTSPVYLCRGEVTLASNMFSEVAGRLSSSAVKPSTIIQWDGSSTVYWSPTIHWIGGDAANLLWRKLVRTVEKFVPRRPAVFFSGGIDSTLLARACDEAGLSPVLLSVGVEGSRDRLNAGSVAGVLGLELVGVELTHQDIKAQLPHIISHIPSTTAMDISIALAFYTLALKASEMGLDVAVAGQGADELYGGYHKYLRVLEAGGYDGLRSRLMADVMGLYETGLPRDVTASREGGVYLVLPYLSRDMVSLGLSIPVELKVAYVDGRPVRKYVLREVARMLGLDMVAEIGKTALQYGTGLEKAVRRAFG
ncbi:MAG: asparagine synthase-related protein, partial [Nitrososphaerota archaeon]